MGGEEARRSAGHMLPPTRHAHLCFLHLVAAPLCAAAGAGGGERTEGRESSAAVGEQRLAVASTLNSPQAGDSLRPTSRREGDTRRQPAQPPDMDSAQPTQPSRAPRATARTRADLVLHSSQDIFNLVLGPARHAARLLLVRLRVGGQRRRGGGESAGGGGGEAGRVSGRRSVGSAAVSLPPLSPSQLAFFTASAAPASSASRSSRAAAAPGRLMLSLRLRCCQGGCSGARVRPWMDVRWRCRVQARVKKGGGGEPRAEEMRGAAPAHSKCSALITSARRPKLQAHFSTPTHQPAVPTASHRQQPCRPSRSPPPPRARPLPSPLAPA